MDAEMILERMRLLAEQKNFDAMKELCKSTTLIAITKVVTMMHYTATDGVVQLLAAVKPRDFSEVTLSETEIEPRLASLLAGRGIVTLGQLAATSDSVLLAIPMVDAPSVWKARDVQKKYLSTREGRETSAIKMRGKRPA